MCRQFCSSIFFSQRQPIQQAWNNGGQKVRAAYRLNEAEFPLGYDIVFVGRNDIGEKKTQDIERFIKKRLIKEMNKPVPKNNRSGRAKRK